MTFTAEVARREPYELSANVSMLFTEVPYPDRFAAASDAGFRAVESWWPFADATPAEAEIDGLVAAIQTAGVRLTGLNFFAGDMPAGARGIVSDPARVDEFRANVAVMVGIAERTGCRHFNALYGAGLDGVSATRHEETAVENLAFAADALAALGGTVLIEPLSGVEAFPIRTADDVDRIIEAVRARTRNGRIGLLYDTFHLSRNGADLVAVAQAFGPTIGHVQLADDPGRGEPGSGGIDFERILAALGRAGYAGLVACEYTPTVATPESLGWIDELAQQVAR